MCIIMVLCSPHCAAVNSSTLLDQEAETVSSIRPSIEIGPWYQESNAPTEESSEATWRRTKVHDV